MNRSASSGRITGEAARPAEYPVLPRSFVQEKQYEVHTELSALHRITSRWWENVQGNARHDPRYMARSLRATAQTLSALAEQVETEIEKARIRLAVDGGTAGEGAAAAGGDLTGSPLVSGVSGEQPLHQSPGEAA